MIRGRRVYAKRCPEPGDIIWENVPIKKKRRYLSTAIIFLISIIILIPTFALVIHLYKKKSEYVNQKREGWDVLVTYILQISLSLAIWIINVIIEIYIEIVSPFEKQMTFTELELSKIYKLVILKLSNTCIVPLASHINNIQNWSKEHGLIEEVTFLIIFMSIGEILRVIFNILYFLKIAQRKLISYKGQSSTATQLQANEAFENEEIEIYMTLSVVLVFVFSILFFAPIIPGLSIFGIIGSITIYWVYKALILRRLSIK